jgi:hypothetical protein
MSRWSPSHTPRQGRGRHITMAAVRSREGRGWRGFTWSGRRQCGQTPELFNSFLAPTRFAQRQQPAVSSRVRLSGTPVTMVLSGNRAEMVLVTYVLIYGECTQSNEFENET